MSDIGETSQDQLSINGSRSDCEDFSSKAECSTPSLCSIILPEKPEKGSGCSDNISPDSLASLLYDISDSYIIGISSILRANITLG